MRDCAGNESLTFSIVTVSMNAMNAQAVIFTCAVLTMPLNAQAMNFIPPVVPVLKGH